MRALIILSLLVFAACGDDTEHPHPSDDAGVDKIVGCIDQPGLPAAPSGALPCDLVPPGLELTP